MNILYISYDGMTDPLGQSQVIPYLAGLSKHGHTITIISCDKKERFAKFETYIRNLLSEDNISWISIPYSQKHPIFSKQLNISKIEKKAKEICKKQKIDIVHCRSYMAALVGLTLKKKYNVKFIFDMRGFWADERMDGKIWTRSNVIHKRLYRFFKKKELEFLINADYTISLTENAKNEILSWKELLHKKIKIEVIPCCADLDLFSQKSLDLSMQQQLKNKLKIQQDDFIISYLGSLGTWYMLDEMLDFFKCLVDKKPSAKFLFITPDDKDSILVKAKLKGISKDKLIIHSASRNEVPLYLSLSAISIYFIKPLYSKKASSPTKTAEIMGLGIPIITNTGIGDSDNIIEQSKAGMLISEFTNNEYLRIISQIDVLLNADKTKIISAAQSYFSLEKGIKLYQDVYNELSSKQMMKK